MSHPAAMQSFDAIFQNQPLQAQLNYGITESAPEVPIPITEENDCSLLANDLKAALEMQTERSDQQLEAVA